MQLRYIIGISLGTCLLIGVLLLAAGFLIFQSFATAGPAYAEVFELPAMAAELRGPEDSLQVTVRGNVVDQSIQTTQKGVLFRLRGDGDATQVTISFAHTPPEGLEGGREVHVKGRLFKNGIVEADEINAKCPSKYEGEGG